jgi:hypothetical protein
LQEHRAAVLLQANHHQEHDMNMEQANEVTSIVCEDDAEMVVHIRRVQAGAPVWYTYAGEDGSTPFQTADMPMGDQAAAKKVNEWLEGS